MHFRNTVPSSETERALAGHYTVVEDVAAFFKQLGWMPCIGLPDEQMAVLEADLGVALPSDLPVFLQWSNGGEAFLGEAYVALSSAAEMREANSEDFRKFYPALCKSGATAV